MRLTISNAIPTNHALKHAFNQAQIKNNHRKLRNSANIAEEMATLSHDVFCGKLINAVKSILNLDNNMTLNLNLPHRKCLKIFSKTVRIYQINVPLKLMFLHIKRIIVLPHNHLSEKVFLPQDKDPLPMIIEI